MFDLEKLKNNKKALTILGVFVVAVLLLYLASGLNNQPGGIFGRFNIVSRQNNPQPNAPEKPKLEEINTPQFQMKELIRSRIPIYIPNMKTSVGIDTTLNIYLLKYSSENEIYMEIYGVDYQKPGDDPAKNPNVVAFKETFLEGKRRLEAAGVDMKKANMVYGTKAYINNRAKMWIQQLNLLP